MAKLGRNYGCEKKWLKNKQPLARQLFGSAVVIFQEYVS